ncbi:hypothetical protein ElyMa_000971400 [Elysia marginata]|uniref:Uncharacterized protein n=1 Tax=Elysia marginata TaxID=1093978 RepID=A0AAV4HFA1_9GAST|nr:hypothetical protein ElyMa_000971400 [Elysia marginata]
MADDEASMQDTNLDVEEEELFDSQNEEVLKPTLSDILLSAEDKRARKEYRLAASKCCVEEAWRMYRRVTNSDIAIEPANLNEDTSTDHLITRMGVLYDPTAGMRMRFLKNKFAHLLSGFRSIKEAAYRPFIRCQKPQKTDIEGQGRAMPAVAKAYHPEVYVTYTYPSTFACKEKWSKIYNSNFMTKEDRLREVEDKEAQTWQLELSVEKFDIEDIPFDKEGNPIGRSVGICEWCGKSILPIPTEYTLSTELNLEALYCCDKYRLFLDDTRRATQAIETEYARAHSMINIESRKSKKSVQDKRPSRRSSVQKASRMFQSHVASFVGLPDDPRQIRFSGLAEDGPFRDKGVDTFDLPWDPAETRVQQTQQAMEKYLDQGQVPNKTTLNNIDILLELEEVYSYRNSANNLDAAAQQQQTGSLDA